MLTHAKNLEGLSPFHPIASSSGSKEGSAHAVSAEGRVAIPCVTERVTEAATMAATFWSSAALGWFEMGMKKLPWQASMRDCNLGQQDLDPDAE